MSGPERYGVAGNGGDGIGVVWIFFKRTTGEGVVGPGRVWHGLARCGKVGQGPAGFGEARLGLFINFAIGTATE